MRKKFLAVFLLAMILGLSMVSSAFAAVVESGNCGAQGDNVTWVLDDNGTLTISGIGDMDDYSGMSEQPWRNNRDNIREVIISDGITCVGDSTFWGCVNLTSVNIGNNVERIGEYAFYQCGNLTDVNFGSGLVTIGYSAFESCGNLKTVLLPDSVADIGVSAFHSCKNLESIQMPKSATNLGLRAFQNCSALKSIEIPDGVSEIGIYTFYGCTSLASVHIPDSVTSIGAYAFSNCTNLKTLYMEEGVKSLGNYAFANCSSLTDVHMPDSLISVRAYIFSNCTSLTDFRLGKGIRTIGEGMFSGCTNLKSITIPSSVQAVIVYAFEDCKSLKDVYYYGSEAEWNDLSISVDNRYLTNATIHYNSTDPDNPSGDGDDDTDYPEKYELSLNYLNNSVLQIGKDITVKAYCDFDIDPTLTADDFVWSIEDESVLTILDTDFKHNSNVWEASIKLHGNSLGTTNITCTVKDVESKTIEMRVELDHWSFVNLDSINGGKWPTKNGYYISLSDYSRLISNLSNTDRRKISFAIPPLQSTYNLNGLCLLAPSFAKWVGSCEGIKLYPLSRTFCRI